MRTTKVVAAALVALLLATLTISGGVAEADARSSSGQEATYQVTITNTTSGQYLTPPNWAAHAWGTRVFQRGTAPSEGVAAVAELGAVDVLQAELVANIDNAGLGISGVAGPVGDEPPPIGPGQSRSFEFTTDQREFSVVAMIVCTNDGFGGINSARLPGRDGQTRRYNLRDFDAGAELNTENRADIVPAPFCSTPPGSGGGNGADQPEINGQNIIRRHPTLQGVGDMPLSFDWRRGSVGEVTVTRVDEPTKYSVVVENLTGGQYFTPPNFAAHSRSADVWSLGAAPSPGVAAVAELGGVPVLAAELEAAIDAQGLGVSGVALPPAGEDPPIGPGGTRSFEFATTENRLSIVSMVICTNDGFAGLDSKRLPQWEGESRTYYLRAYDAGAELNTENRADLVPAPFCNGPGGTDQDQPEIDGQNIIRRHPTLKGVGDLPLSFDWRGPVLAVTVTNNG